jgi:putative iron-regulated protein
VQKHTMMKKISIILLYVLGVNILFTAVSCNKNDEEKEVLQMKKEVLAQYANIVSKSYEDCYSTALQLKMAIDAFVANPTDNGFQQCKDAWLTARLPYGQTEAYRFYGGPIDKENGAEGYINAWPMDENFVDYVAGNPSAGIINSPAQYPIISKQVLVDLNESISETSIFTGYHAIEFLLWGQDMSTTTAGMRPYTDYLVSGGTAANQARRGEYLRVAADLLLEQLAGIREEWKIGGAYRNQFLNSTETKVALGFIFTSLGELSKGELSGERMFVAIDTKDQENEHSCFSDNTLNDIKMNFLGLQNVYFGQYKAIDNTTLSGRSISEIAEKLDRTKADAVRAAFADAEQKINLIPAPFDQTIVNNPDAVLPAITALRTLSDKFADVGLLLEAQF